MIYTLDDLSYNEDLAWWHKMAPAGWRLSSWTNRYSATFVTTDEQRVSRVVTVYGDFMTGVYNNAQAAASKVG